MSYLPPHRRFAAATTSVVNTFKPKSKKEHREEFPVLRDELGRNVVAVLHAPAISWTNIKFSDDDVITAAPKLELKEGWIDLRTYVPDHSTTSAQLNKCAENMLSNYRRFYVERDMQIPEWVTDNPYNEYADFERTIPYDNGYVSETDSSTDGEDPVYESDGSI